MFCTLLRGPLITRNTHKSKIKTKLMYFSFHFYVCPQLGNSSNLASSNTQNGHKANSYQGGDSPAIASPARRSEVSPIQNHVSTHSVYY